MSSAFTARNPRRGLATAFGLAAVLALMPASHATAQDEIEPFADTSRLVTIGGSLTEIVYAFGAQEMLVARDTTSVYPESATKLPDIGYMRQLSPEGVLSVDPSAILALADSGPPETVEVLEKAGVPLVMVPESFDREGILDKIDVVGHTLGLENKADALAQEVSKDIEAAEALTADIAEDKRRRVLFILSMQGGRLMASGTGTAADGIIAMAGGVNAVTGYEGYKQLSDEAVIEARPDVVLMMDRGGEFAVGEDELFAHSAIAATPAADNRNLVSMDGAYLLGFGPRTASAVRDLAVALYGEAVAD